MKGDNFLKQPEIDGSLFRKSLQCRLRAESSPFSYVKNQVLRPFLRPKKQLFHYKKKGWNMAQSTNFTHPIFPNQNTSISAPLEKPPASWLLTLLGLRSPEHALEWRECTDRAGEFKLETSDMPGTCSFLCTSLRPRHSQRIMRFQMENNPGSRWDPEFMDQLDQYNLHRTP